MDVIQTANKHVDKFGAGLHGFSPGNPGSGLLATSLSQDWCDNIQQEIVNAILGSGATLNPASKTQLREAIAFSGSKVASAAGTADAITAEYVPDIGALVDGMIVHVRAAAANATTTPTFTPNSGVITPRTIVREANAPLQVGDIAGVGHWLALQYDQTLNKWVLRNPKTLSGADVLAQITATCLGVGQTWQDMTASRATGTTYTNATGRPIMVLFFWSSGAPTPTVGGVALPSPSAANSNTPTAYTFIVQAGATYSLSSVASGFSWFELR